MKKTFLILSAAVVLSSVAWAKGNKTLIEQGLSLASLMSEKANSETYLALFLDGTQTPVQIETFGLEHIGEYLDGNRLITHKAARKLREFGTSGAKK